MSVSNEVIGWLYRRLPIRGGENTRGFELGPVEVVMFKRLSGQYSFVVAVGGKKR